MPMIHRIVALCSLLACAGLPAAQAQEVLYSDDFESRSGKQPREWQFDTTAEGFWVAQDGWLNSGKGRDLVTADQYSFAVVATPGAERWTDYAVRTRFTMNQPSGRVILVGRWKNRQNHYMATLEIYAGRRIIRLAKRTNDEIQELASLVLDPESDAGSIDLQEPSKPVAMSMTLLGTGLSVALNGATVLKAQDFDIASGAAGLGQRHNDIRFSEFQVVVARDNIDVPPPPPSGDKVYRVQLAETKDLAEANITAVSLREQGFFPSLRSDGAVHKLYIGQFASETEARKMQAHLVSERFAFAKVVLVDLSAEPPVPPGQEPGVTAPIETAAVLDSDAWRDLTRAQQKKVIDTMAVQQSMRMGLQSVEQILDLQKRVKELSEKQVTILNQMSTAQEEKDQNRRAIARLAAQIRRKKQVKDWDGALVHVEQLEKIDPNSPLARMERDTIEHRKNRTFAGSDVLRQQKLEAMLNQKDRARVLASTGDLEGALSVWRSIHGGAIGDNDKLAAEATQKIEELTEEIRKKREDEDKKRGKATENRLYVILGVAFGAAFFLLFLLYLAGRRREARLLRQLQDEAIAPLQELQAKASLLGGGGVGLAFEQEDKSLLEQVETPDAEFMIPETPDTETTPPETDQAPAGGIPETPLPDFSMEEPPALEAQEPADFSAPGTTGPDDTGSGFVMDFGGDKSAPSEGVLPPLPQEQTSDSSQGDSEIVFSFDETQSQAPGITTPDESTGHPITAQVVPESQSTPSSDEIVFSFDDTADQQQDVSSISLTPDDAPKTEEEDSLYESIPLDDLSLDIGGPGTEETAVSNPSEPAPSTPMMDLDSALDLDLDLGLPSADAPQAAQPPATTAGEDSLPSFEFPEESTLTSTAPPHGETGGGADILLQQDHQSAPLGQLPEGWTGDNTEAASLTVVSDPAGQGGQCMAFKKTAGDGPTNFQCRFPDITGKIVVEFDMRCDEKNKHLLGFYIEEDADFRRSINTVVQCIDPAKPAHLRLATRPTPYDMGEWRRIKYIIDLNESLVDGYVDDTLVNEGWRMGAKISKLNTLSIRDDTETTGALYINNLVIRKAPAEA